MLFLFIPLFFLSCNPKSKKDKIEYNGKLKYFTDRNGYEHFISEDSINGANIILPECFKLEHQSSVGLSNKFIYYCDKNATYLTVDPISKKDINKYRKYFDEDTDSHSSDIELLRDYFISIREAGLIDPIRSVYSSTTTETGEDMILGSVKGKRYPESEELFYQFAVIENKNTYYVLQAILSKENTAFLLEDVLTIFRSFEENGK